METVEREAMIEVLVIFEGKADSYYRAMSADQLQMCYVEHLRKGEEIE